MTAERILIVDDYAMNVKLATFILEAAGFETSAASTAHEAIELVASFQPALILMDIQLPGMDGLTLTAQLKADPATSNIVIVAFTAYAMKGDEIKILAAGCDGYIAKPIDVAAFAGQIRAYLDARADPTLKLPTA